jgi:hypothetical protein
MRFVNYGKLYFVLHMEMHWDFTSAFPCDLFTE